MALAQHARAACGATRPAAPGQRLLSGQRAQLGPCLKLSTAAQGRTSPEAPDANREVLEHKPNQGCPIGALSGGCCRRKETQSAVSSLVPSAGGLSHHRNEFDALVQARSLHGSIGRAATLTASTDAWGRDPVRWGPAMARSSADPPSRKRCQRPASMVGVGIQNAIAAWAPHMHAQPEA